MKGLTLIPPFCVTLVALHFGRAFGQNCPGPIETACCPEGEVFWNASGLYHESRSGGIEAYYAGQQAVHVLETSSLNNHDGQVCASNALVLVRFEPMIPLQEENVECMSGYLCGRRILRLEFAIERSASEEEWLFEIGDLMFSYTSGIIRNPPNSLLVANRGRVGQLLSTRCRRRHFAYLEDARNVSRVLVFISHQFLMLSVDGYERFQYCWECLWNLNKINDTNTVLIGVNRPIRSWDDDRGHGICNVRFRWICPYCDRFDEHRGGKILDSSSTSSLTGHAGH